MEGKFKLEQSVVQKWPPFFCDGITYDLSHLDAHTVIFRLKEGTELRFYVTYSHHCFAKDCPSGTNEDVKWLYQHGNEHRRFHMERYELSKMLPALVPKFMNFKTYHAGYDNYAFCKILDGEIALYYKVTFVVYREQKKFRMHITSAYRVGENSYDKKRSVGFAAIINALARNKKLPTPK